VLGIGAAVAFFVAGRLARPIRRLSDAAVQLGEGDFEVDLPRSPVPEIDDANRALTTTAHHLDELVSRERSFSADASHQLRTPLAGLRAAIETELEFPRDDHALVLREVLGDIDRLEETITELRAGPPVTLVRGHDPTEVLREVEREWHGRLAALGRPLIVDAESLPLVQGPPAARATPSASSSTTPPVTAGVPCASGLRRVWRRSRSRSATMGRASPTPSSPAGAPDEAGDGLHGVGLPAGPPARDVDAGTPRVRPPAPAPPHRHRGHGRPRTRAAGPPATPAPPVQPDLADPRGRMGWSGPPARPEYVRRAVESGMMRG
jgi:HAMP domain-containing protein